MNILLIYMVKAAVYLAGFYIIYFIFLSKDTQYIRNRLFIIFSVIAAFILPAISVNIREQSSIYYFGKTLSEVFVTADGNNGQVITGAGNSLNVAAILYRIYITGVIIFSLKLLIDILSLIFLITRNKKTDDNIIYFKGFNTPGFSAMGNIFINRTLGKKEADEIIRHEQNHIDNKHFLDILFIEAALILQWFNPFVYLINRSLRAIHEYQADLGCLKSGMPVKRYQNLLLSHVFRTGKMNISNSFSNPSLIRKRMIMMSKEPSGNSSSLKILLVIPVAILFLMAISACEKSISLGKTFSEAILPETPVNQIIDINQGPVYREPNVNELLPPPPPPPPPADKSQGSTNATTGTGEKKITELNMEDVPAEVFVVVEQMPTFPGGDKALMEFINSHIVYPENAKTNNIVGRVILRFAVMANGKVSQVTVLKPVNPDLDNEAKRVIETLPDWTPGRQGGKPVNVWYSVPVTFQLQ
jgi:TonB family protein